ncbi:MAG TPA: winged helix-turn-helix domain-containing protein, partial [Solirubrobacter sp.]
ARGHPLPPGQKTLVHRRTLAVGAGEAPGPVLAAAMLDVKRDYFTMRPHLGRLYFAVADPEPLMPALVTLGFALLEQPAVVGDVAFHLAALDFGPESIDGWLADLAAAELGIPRSPLLDAGDRTVDVEGLRVRLSPLEFGVLEALHERAGRPVSRVDLLATVWGTDYTGGSNVVDVVVRALRRKLDASAGRIETVRGVGYRLR